MATSAIKNKNFRMFAIIAILTSLVVTVLVIQNRTSTQNEAALGYPDLNSIVEVKDSSLVNADGTMGSQSFYGNYSQSLSSSKKGNLEFRVIDPLPTGIGKPTGVGNNRPTKKPLPTQAQGGKPEGASQSGSNAGGPQDITALNLTISKVEVHLANLGKPASGSPTITPSLQGLNKWETLNVSPTSVDLINLAITKDFAKLGITSLAAGRYTEVRLYVTKATATLSDGRTVDLSILGKNKIVRVVRTFYIETGKTTVLTMDLDAVHSVIKVGDSYLLKPVVARLIEER